MSVLFSLVCHYPPMGSVRHSFPQQNLHFGFTMAERAQKEKERVSTNFSVLQERFLN